MQVVHRAGTATPVLHLPCEALTHLQRLSIKYLTVRLSSSVDSSSHDQESDSSEQAGAISSSTGRCSCSETDDNTVTAAQPTTELLPQLQRLQLVQCTLPLESLWLLSRITGLTSLQLQGVQAAPAAPDADDPFSAMEGGLNTSAMEGGLNTALSNILQHATGLSELTLATPAHNAPWYSGVHRLPLASLPTSLTFLQLQSTNRKYLCLQPQHTRLTRLSRLQHLQLSKATIPAALLARMTALQRITLSEAYAVPSALWEEGNEDGRFAQGLVRDSRVMPLLAALKQLPAMRHLQLSCTNDASVVAALSALTQLTAVEITERGMPTECGAVHKALHGRVLPRLQLLRLVAKPHGTGSHRTYSWDPRDKASCLDTKDMRSIVHSCPGLQHLILHGVVGPGVHLGCLQTLSHLQALSIAGAAFKDAAAVAVAQVTSLQGLEWSDSPLTAAGLQRLTALRGLTRLVVANCPAVAAPLSQRYADVGQPTQPSNKLMLQFDQEMDGPAVWQILQQLCPSVQPRMEADNKQDSPPARDQNGSNASAVTKHKVCQQKVLKAKDDQAAASTSSNRSAKWRTGSSGGGSSSGRSRDGGRSK